MAELDAGLTAAFAEGMLPKVLWLRKGGRAPHEVSAVRSSLTQEIRKLCDALAPEHLRPVVSPSAAQAARVLGVDLCLQAWGRQTAWDPGRRVFHLEHVVPVAEVRARVLLADTVVGIRAALAELKVAWILKTEDAELERLGYRSRRDDPESAYREAGIELIPCPHV